MKPLAALLIGLTLLPLPARAGGKTPPATGASRAYDQAFAALKRKAYAEALPLYEQALAQAPKRPELWNEYAICLRNLRRFPASLRAGWRAIQLDARHTPQPWSAQANTFMETRAWASAEACLAKVEALDPDKGFVAHAWLNLAFRKLSAREPEGVVALCRRASRLAPKDSLVWLDLAQAQACSGADPTEALTSVEKGLALAKAQKDAQRTAYAEQLLKKVTEKQSVWPPFVVGAAWQVIPGHLASLPATDASALTLPETVEHRYALPDGKALCLTTPEAWTEGFDQPRPDNLFSVQLTPAAPGFKLFLSPLKPKSHPEGLEAMATKVAQLLLPGSVEKELKPEPFSGPEAKGFRLFSTNKNAVGKAPGEYRHLLSAFLITRDQPCVGTVLLEQNDAEVQKVCLGVFQCLRVVP